MPFPRSSTEAGIGINRKIPNGKASDVARNSLIDSVIQLSAVISSSVISCRLLEECCVVLPLVVQCLVNKRPRGLNADAFL